MTDNYNLDAGSYDPVELQQEIDTEHTCESCGGEVTVGEYEAAGVCSPCYFSDDEAPVSVGKPKQVVCVAGGRDLLDKMSVYDATDALIKQLVAIGISDSDDFIVLEGGAKGGDDVGRSLAVTNGVELRTIPADWEDVEVTGALVRTRADGSKYNARAGFARNLKMAQQMDVLIAFWDGKSSGTNHMISTARGLGKPFHIINY